MEKKNAILFIMDINGIMNNNFYYDNLIDSFYEKINDKRQIEGADEIVIVLTDFNDKITRDVLHEYALELKQLIEHDVKFYIYPYISADKKIDISDKTSYEMQCINNRNKYDFINNVIENANKKYNVVYTALMQNISSFDTNEEFQAKEQIEKIKGICNFDLLFSSSSVNDLNNIYNDHLVISDEYGLYGYATSLETKINIDKGIIPDMRYHEFYKKNKEENAMLIIIDASNLKENNYHIDFELYKNIIAKKKNVKTDNLYIVVSNKTANSHTKEELDEIARKFKYILSNDAKIFSKVNQREVIYQTEFFNSTDYGFLKHATEIKNAFSKKYKANLIHTSYFTNFNNYKRIDADVRQGMIDSDIEFLAHSAENDIEGVICSKKSGFMALNDCIKLSMNENLYSDNEPKNNTINNEEITVFYCDIADTIDDIFGYEWYMEELNNKLLELKQMHDSNKILLSLITNDSSLEYLIKYINKLKPELDDSVIFTDHFFANGALIDGEILQENETIGNNKFAKIKYHLNKLINDGYKINYAYFADDNMFAYGINNFYEYLPNDVRGQLLIPAVGFGNVPNNVIASNQLNIAGLIDCINKSIELECPKEKGTAYSKQYSVKPTEEDDDDDDLPF